MFRFCFERLLGMALTLVGVLTVVFFLVRSLPGDPAAYMLGDYATKSSLAALRADLGLDQPLWSQFVIFMHNAVTGDFGTSTVTQRSALTEVAAVLPASLLLAGVGVSIAILVGVPLGVLAAVRRGSRFDTGSMLVTLVALSVPVFWMGLVGILIFTEWLGWLPAVGYSTAGGLSSALAIVMPAAVLALSVLAYIARLTRSSMLEVLDQDYIRVARAFGVNENTLIWRHAFRNAAVPIVAVVGVTVAFAIGNSILVEVVFSRPGVGTLILKAIQARDYQLVQAGVLALAAVVVVLNTMLDMIYAVIDPRVRKS